MGRRDYLGEFELVVLLALTRLGPGAYGGSIHSEILARTGRDVSIPAVYVTLKRMEAKGLVTSSMGDSEADVSRPTKNYTITDDGRRSVERSRRLFQRLWDGLDAPLAEAPGS